MVGLRATIGGTLAGYGTANVIMLSKDDAAALAVVLDAWPDPPESIRELRDGVRRFIGA
jgi:hypothetical protein